MRKFTTIISIILLIIVLLSIFVMNSHSNIETLNPIYMQIVPIPQNPFNSNTVTVTDPILDNDFKWDRTGNYVVSASSYSSDEHKPEKAFNKISDSYWECDYANNSAYNKNLFGHLPYTTNPYYKSPDGASIYRLTGGGSTSSNFFTWVGPKGNEKDIPGEWLQIKIPSKYPIYLYKYSILTPTPRNGVITFPKSFIIVGSMDGVAWNYIDQQTMKDNIDTTNRAPVVFNVNSENKYCYFRIIIKSLYQQKDIIQINQLALYGTSIPTFNKSASM